MIQNRVRLNTLTQKKYAFTNTTGVELITPNELGTIKDTLFSRDGTLYFSVHFDERLLSVQVPFHDCAILPPKIDRK